MAYVEYGSHVDLQQTEADLDAILANQDEQTVILQQIEDNTDGLETLITSSNTKLDTLHSDNLVIEGKQDLTNTKLDEIEQELDDANLSLDNIEASTASIDSKVATAANQVLEIAQLTAINSNTDAIETKIDTLHSDNVVIETKLDSIITQATAINANTDTLESLITSTNTKIDSTNTKLDTVNTNLGTLHTDNVTIEGKLDTLHSDVDGVEGLITATNTKLDSVITQVTAINSNTDTVETLITSTNTKLDTANTNLTTINSNVDGLETLVTSTNTKIDTVSTNITSTNTKLDTLHADVDGLETLVTSTNTKLDTLHSDLVTVEGKQDTGNASLSTIATNTGNINTNLTNSTQKTQIVQGGNSAGVLANGDGTYSLQVAQSATDFIFSAYNIVNYVLTAGSTYTSTVEANTYQQAASILLTSDKNGVFTFNQYIDAGGTQLAATRSWTITAGTGFSRAFPYNGNYANFTFRNTAGTSTAALNINVAYGTIATATNLGNTPISLDELNGVSISTGVGTGDSGTQRITLSSDSVVSSKIALTASSPTFATVGTGSAQAVASNASRKGLILVNTSVNVISVGIGATAVLNSGITLKPGGSWNMDEYSYSTAVINCIASLGSSNLAIQEFT